MHMQQYACLVFVVDPTRCMVFDYGKYIQQAQSTAVAIPRSPLFSVSLFSLLFSIFFCLLYFEFCFTWRVESEDVYRLYVAVLH